MIHITQYLMISLSVFLNKIAARRVRSVAETRLESPYLPLPDLGHDMLPKLPLHLPDYLLVASIVLFSSRLYFVPLSQALLGRHLEAVAHSLMLRSFTVIATVFPTCVPRPPNKQTLYQETFVSTHDLMFSGHTLVFTFLGSVIKTEYEPILCWLGNIVTFLLPMTLIMSRQHYTNDVIVSAIVYRYFLQRAEN